MAPPFYRHPFYSDVDPIHHLRRFSSHPAHRTCYYTQDDPATERETFAFALEWLRKCKRHRIAWRNPRIALAVAPEMDRDVATLFFAATGTGPCISLPDWEAWLADEYRALETLRAPERDDYLRALPILEERFPDPASLTRGLPWYRMKADVMNAADRWEREERLNEALRQEHLARCESALARVRQAGARCPVCERTSRDYRHMVTGLFPTHFECPHCRGLVLLESLEVG
jgi:hypothetical protein